MAESQQRGRRYGKINDEPMPFVSSVIDDVTGLVHVSLVQRGNRTVERIEAMMREPQLRIQLPEMTEPLQTVPVSIDVTSTGTGQQALYRVVLKLRLEPSDIPASAEARQAADETRNATSVSPDLDARLDRIEAKLDRILSLLEHTTRTPSDAG